MSTTANSRKRQRIDTENLWLKIAQLVSKDFTGNMTKKELFKQTIIELLKEDEEFRNEIAQAVFNHNDFCDAVGNAQYDYEREQDRAEARAWT